MEGATKLIEFRGVDQLGRREGLDLFTQLRAQIVSFPVWKMVWLNPKIPLLTIRAFSILAKSTRKNTARRFYLSCLKMQ